MICAAFALCWLACIKYLSVDYLPEMSPRHILVSICYDDMKSEDVRKMIAVPAENAFGTIKSLKNITSVSRDGIAIIDLEIHFGTDVEISFVEAKKISDELYEQLPSGCSRPFCSMSEGNEEILSFCVVPSMGNLIDTRKYCENILMPLVQRIRGVGKVKIQGGEKEEIQIIVEKDKADKVGMTLGQISEIITMNNYEYPAGFIHDGNKELSVKSEGLFTSIKEIEDTALISGNGNDNLLVKDIAKVKRGVQRKETFSCYNGREGVLFSIYKTTGCNPFSVSKKVKSIIFENLDKDRYDVYLIDDISKDMKKILWDLILQTLAGTAAVFFVVKFFLGSFIVAAIASCSIPLSFMFSMMILEACGLSLNTISMSGFTISAGMVVDCSVVVIEGIMYQLSSNKGALSVIKSCIISSITSVIVFVPFLFFKNSFTDLYSSMAVTITSSIFFSFIVAFTFVVSCSSIMLKNGFSYTESRQLSLLKDLYLKYLGVVKVKKWQVCIVSMVIFIFCLFLLKFKKFEMYATGKFDHAIIKMNLQPDLSIDGMTDVGNLIYESMSNFPEIDFVLVNGGLNHDDVVSLSSPYNTSQMLDIYIKLYRNVEKIPESILCVLDNYGKYDVRINDNIFSEFSKYDGKYLILGDSPEEVRNECLSLGKSEERKIIPLVQAKEYALKIDRSACAKFDVSNAFLHSIVSNAMDGITSSLFYESGNEIEIKVRYRHDDVSSISDLKYLSIPCGDQRIPLHAVSSIENICNEKILFRYNRKDCKVIDGQVCGDFYVPDQEEKKQITFEIVWMIVFVLLFLYLITGMCFESFFVPVMMILCLPSVFCGWIFFLSVARAKLDMASLTGLIVLLGNAVNNFVILYEKCELNDSKDWQEIAESSIGVIQTLVLTNATTIIALIPFSFLSSVAFGIIGGILGSLIFTLSAGPLMISFYRRKNNNHVIRQI